MACLLLSINIITHYTAEKEAWSHGMIEASVQDVKRTASAIHLEALDQDPYVTMYLAVASLNATECTAGYSAFQWAYGQNYNHTDEDVRTFSSLPEDARHDSARLVTAREKAEMIARKGRSQRILSKLVNSTVRQPLCQFKELGLVKVRRRFWPSDIHRGPRGGMKKSGCPH